MNSESKRKSFGGKKNEEFSWNTNAQEFNESIRW